MHLIFVALVYIVAAGISSFAGRPVRPSPDVSAPAPPMTDTTSENLPAPQSPRIRSRWMLASVRTIVALMLREMSTRYGRSPGGYIWAVLEPLGMICILAFGFSLLMRTPSLGTSFILFYATGFLPYNYFQTTSRFVGMALRFSRPLLTYPAVTWIDAVLGRLILNTLTALIVSYLLLTGIGFFTGERFTITVAPIFQAYALAAVLGTGVGLVNCVLIGFVPIWDSIWSIITRPLFLASGIIIIYEELPPLAQSILWWNPLMHVTALMRAGFYPLYRPEFVSIPFVAIVGLTLTFLGLVFMQRYHKDILTRT